MPSFARPARLLAVVSMALALVAPIPAFGAFDPGSAASLAPAPPQRSMPHAPSAAAVAAVLRPLAGPVLDRLGAAAMEGSDAAFSPAAAAIAARAATDRSSTRPVTASDRRPGTRSRHPGVTRPTPPVRYRGTNHMWIPSLGIDRAVSWFPCSRSTPPGLAVYRWGCAGANNVYLFAHAYAAFEPLHDAYVSDRLRTGMTVVYGDGSGRVHTYAVAWWRLTTPDHGEFAYAAQSRPSLTLQTCVGARSQYRLIVRLFEVS